MKINKVHIGLRTIKSAVAALISMMIVDIYGNSVGKYVFAVMGAMQVTQKTIKQSLDACLTQAVGVTYGAIIGLLLLNSPLPPFIAAALGIIILVTTYNTFNIKYPPIMPCVVITSICTVQSAQPVTYALGRLIDTFIGLGVGLIINIYVFPYDNINVLRKTSESLDEEILKFLYDTFNKNGQKPCIGKARKYVNDLTSQIQTFANQWFLLDDRQHREDYELYKLLDKNVETLIAHMKAIDYMEILGKLDDVNIELLKQYGIEVDERETIASEEYNIVTNYHVNNLILIHQQISEILQKLNLK